MANVSDWGRFVRLLDCYEAQLASLVAERTRILQESKQAAKSVLWDSLPIVAFDIITTAFIQQPPEDDPWPLCMILFYVFITLALLLVFLSGKLSLGKVRGDCRNHRLKISILRTRTMELSGELEAEAARLGVSPPRNIEFRAESVLIRAESPVEFEVVGWEWMVHFTVICSIVAVFASAVYFFG